MTFQEDPLLSGFELRGLKLRNRIVMSPMTRGFSPGGVPGQNVANYYSRRAQRKVGLIITEGIGVDHQAKRHFFVTRLAYFDLMRRVLGTWRTCNSGNAGV